MKNCSPTFLSNDADLIENAASKQFWCSCMFIRCLSNVYIGPFPSSVEGIHIAGTEGGGEVMTFAVEMSSGSIIYIYIYIYIY
jgi:hypothetical protein